MTKKSKPPGIAISDIVNEAEHANSLKSWYEDRYIDSRPTTVLYLVWRQQSSVHYDDIDSSGPLFRGACPTLPITAWRFSISIRIRRSRLLTTGRTVSSR